MSNAKYVWAIMMTKVSSSSTYPSSDSMSKHFFGECSFDRSIFISRINDSDLKISKMLSTAQHSRRSQNFKTYFAVTCVKYVCKIWETGSTVWPPFDVSIKTYFKIPRIQGNSNVGTSCYSRKTVCWKPPCCWLRWEGPWAMVTSIIATKVGLV